MKSLSKTDVVEVKSLNNPPQGVRMVIEAVCIMKGIKPKRVAGDKVVITLGLSTGSRNDMKYGIARELLLLHIKILYVKCYFSTLKNVMCNYLIIKCILHLRLFNPIKKNVYFNA